MNHWIVKLLGDARHPLAGCYLVLLQGELLHGYGLINAIINRIFMDYPPPPYGLFPPCYRQDFWREKIEIVKCAEKLKNEGFKPAAGGKFWGPKPIMDYSPLLTDRFLIRGE